MRDELLATIEAIYAAGMNAELWADALALVTQLIGGVGSTIEVIDRRSFTNLNFFSHGVPPPGEIAYLNYYASISPRIPDALRQPAGELTWDYRILDEKGIDRSPFYSEFLAPMGMRYAIAGILKTADTEFGAFAVQRSSQQGHVDRDEIELMERLTPHVSRALDMTRRLGMERSTSRSLESAFDWLSDGVALIKADGSIVYATRQNYGNYCGSYRDVGYGTLENGRKAINFYGSANYRLSDNASLFLDVQAAASHQISYNTPLQWQNSYMLNGDSTPIPFINQANGNNVEQWQRKYFTIDENGGFAAGEIHSIDNTLALNTGITGTFGTSSWAYEALFGYSQNRLESKEPALVSAKAQVV